MATAPINSKKKTMRPKKSVDVVREFNFDRYINIMFKPDDTQHSLTHEAKHEVNILCHIVAKRIIKKAVDLSRMQQVITLKPLEFETAIKMLFYKNTDYDPETKIYESFDEQAKISLKNYDNNKENTDVKGLTKKAILTISVSRVENVIRYHAGCLRVSPSASIYLASVLQHIMSQINSVASNQLQLNKGAKTITSKHIAQGIKMSEDLSFIFANVILSTPYKPKK